MVFENKDEYLAYLDGLSSLMPVVHVSWQQQCASMWTCVTPKQFSEKD